MSTARMQKEENAQQLREELAQVPHAILVDFQGLNVAGATDLRRKLRDGEARFKVVKNSTVLRAIEDMPLAELNDAFVGQTAIAYTDGDVVNLAKVLTDFHKDFQTPSFKAGIVDGAPISAEEFERLSKLPPREELIGKLVYLMAYPMTGLVTALNGILQGFAIVLDQIRLQKEEAGDTETEAAAAAEPEAATEEAGEAAAAEDSGAEAEAAADEAPTEEAEAAAEEAPAEEAASEEAEAAADEAPAEEPEAAAEDAPADESEEEAETVADEEAAAEGDEDENKE